MIEIVEWQSLVWNTVELSLSDHPKYQDFLHRLRELVAYKKRTTGMLYWRKVLARLSYLFKKILLQRVFKFEREEEGD